MAVNTGHKTRSIIEKLRATPHKYSFYQAINILQACHPECCKIGYFDNPKKEAVRLKNTDSLMFPVSQLYSVESNEDEMSPYYTLETSLSGLYGNLSPLPIFYTASLISSSEEDKDQRQRQRDFLDIFNHRLFSLAYRTENRSKSTDVPFSSSAENFPFAMLSLIGLANSETRKAIGEWKFYNLILDALLFKNIRSASMMQNWLNGHFKDIPITIQEFTPIWKKIPEESRAQIGDRNCSLGSNDAESSNAGVIGDMILESETTFSVNIGPLEWPTFKTFLPGADNYKKTEELISLFTPDWLDFKIGISLLGSECKYLATSLNTKSQLGLTAGIYYEEGIDEDLTLVFDGSMQE
jgi:type VI secretion system protein ImpH